MESRAAEPSLRPRRTYLVAGTPGARESSGRRLRKLESNTAETTQSDNNRSVVALSPGWFYALAVLVVVLDQVVKAWVRGALPVGGSIPLWPGIFHLTHTQNRGMAFSLLEGKVGLLAVAALIVVAVIIAVERRQAGRLPVLLGLSLALPLGGAVGNLIDRVWQGHVTDLFDFRLIHFPVFNVADSAITVGVVLLAWYTLVTPDEKPEAVVEASGEQAPVVATNLSGEGQEERS